MEDQERRSDLWEEDWAEGALETRNRLRNLMWTVSGDYSLETKPDDAAFRESKAVAMYDAVRQGGLARYFDRNALALYLLKKMFCGGNQTQLTALTRLCADQAVFPLLEAERPGVRDIRREAFSYLLDKRFRALNETLVGRLQLAMMRSSLTGNWEYEARIRLPLDKIRRLAQGTDTAALIRTVDELYNAVVDPYFEKQRGTLEEVLGVELDEERRADWRAFLEEMAGEEALEQAMERMESQLTSFDSLDLAGEKEQSKKKRRRIIQVDSEAAARMYSYIEKNYGRSYLTEAEQRALDYRLCRGAHADCRLYCTAGIIASPVMRNAQYVSAVKQAKDNRRLLKNHARVARQNIEEMTAFLRQSLLLWNQPDRTLADHGSVIPRRLWRVSRVKEVGRLFCLERRQEAGTFAVEVLIDASGSQHERQGQVAMQAYMISAALSGAGLPHEIVSFCTFWDYTVLQRYRAFDDPPAEDQKVLDLIASANNRDGLAIRAAGERLAARPEENRILIVLSDGRPNDIIVGRPGSHNPASYAGEYAVRDTAFEVRALRAQGIFVLGVFTGREKDLQAEKRMFGKDFAYIRDIRYFSRTVSAYLQKLLSCR